ncbi:MAG: PD-(D/E)XK nuclease family protein [Synergistaceae bacterium]
MEITTYYNIEEKIDFLTKCYAKFRDEAIFIVPSSLDKEIILRYIMPDTFWGSYPRVMTVGDLYKQILLLTDSETKTLDQPDRTLILKHILSKFIDEMDEKEVVLPKGVRHTGFKSILEKNIKELVVEGITPAYYRDKIFKDDELDLTKPEAILLRLYFDYIIYLKDNNLVDIGQIPTLIKDLLPLENVQEFIKSHQFIFVGFLSFTGSQLKMVKAVDNIKSTYFVMPETGLDDFHDGILQLGSEYKSRPKWDLSVLEVETANSSLQFHTIAREIALWRKDRGLFNEKMGKLENYSDIGVVVNETNLTLLAKSLERYSIPMNIQVRESIADSLIGDLAVSIWGNFIAGWKFEKALALFLNPVIGFSRNEIFNLEKKPCSYNDWAESLSAGLSSRFKAINDFCFFIAKGETPYAILRRWSNLLKEIKVRENLENLIDSEYIFDDALKNIVHSIDELEKKVNSLDNSVGGIGIASECALKGSEAISYINELGRNSSIPKPLIKVSAVSVYVGTPSILTSHKYFVMTDVDFDKWPGVMRESPLLREEVLSTLNQNECTIENDSTLFFHVPNIKEKRAQKEALFRRLLSTAKKTAVLFHSQTDSKGRPTLPSQFVENLFAQKSPINKLSQEPIVYPIDSYIPSKEDYVFPEIEVCDETEGISLNKVSFLYSVPGEMKHVVNLSDIDVWYQCPFRYFCMSKLRLYEPINEIYDPRRAGTLLHKIFEKAINNTDKKNFLGAIESNYKDTIKEIYPELLLDKRLYRHEVKFHQQLFSLGFYLNEVEKKIKNKREVKTEYTLNRYIINDVEFRGVADRIDFYDDGFIVLDYKLGKASSHIDEMQLAAYSMILEETENLKPNGFGWIGLRDCKICGSMLGGYSGLYNLTVSKKRDVLTYDSAISAVKETMMKMAESIKEGVFMPNYNSSACSYCSYKSICRKA